MLSLYVSASLHRLYVLFRFLVSRCLICAFALYLHSFKAELHDAAQSKTSLIKINMMLSHTAPWVWPGFTHSLSGVCWALHDAVLWFVLDSSCCHQTTCSVDWMCTLATAVGFEAVQRCYFEISKGDRCYEIFPFYRILCKHAYLRYNQARKMYPLLFNLLKSWLFDCWQKGERFLCSVSDQRCSCGQTALEWLGANQMGGNSSLLKEEFWIKLAVFSAYHSSEGSCVF